MLKPIGGEQVGFVGATVVVEMPGDLRTAVHRVAETQAHAIGVAREVAAVVREEAFGRPVEVTGLEEPEHHREQREGSWIVVGAGDEPEHLDLRLDGRAVVGEHVDPIVLCERGRRAVRASREREAAGTVETPDPLAERAVGAVFERRPPVVERGVGRGELPGVRRLGGGVEVVTWSVEELVEVPAAFEVDERQTERAVGDATRNAHHVVGDAQPRCVRLDAGRDLRREWNEQELSEQHELEHACAKCGVAEAHRLAELVGADGSERLDVDGDTRHRFGHREDHGTLGDSDSAGRRGRGDRRSRDDLHLFGRRRHEERLVGSRQRDRDRVGHVSLQGCCSERVTRIELA